VKWILSSSFTLLVILLMVDHLDNEVFKFFSIHYWILLFLLPVFCHAFLILRFLHPAKDLLSEEERNTTEHRGMYLTLSGFSFSAFFALVIAASASPSSSEILGASIVLMLLSFMMFYGAFSYEGFKFYRWQVEMVSAMSETGKMSLLASILLAIFSANLASYINIFSLLSFIVFWSTNFGIQLSLRYRYLSAFQER